MPLIAAYHRPRALDEAIALLAEPNRVPIGGGTTVNADREPSDLEVVDLQALGLGGIEPGPGLLSIGATATLADVADCAHAPDVIREIARREAPSTLRTLATVGGAVASGGADSMFVASLLACDAQVKLAAADDMSLAELLDAGVPTGAIITAVLIRTDGTMAYEGTGRTPADTPIVGAIARAADDGITLALTGVAATPVVVDAADPTAGLQPPGDFRGSPGYRRELASVLARRVVEALA